MQPAHLAALALLATPLGRGPELAFAPEEGTTATKTFERRSSLTVDTMDFVIGDQQLPFKLGMELTRVLELEVVDTWGAVADGRPLALERTFETVRSERIHENVPDNVTVTGDGERTSPLQGHAVRFAWDAEEGEYDAKFVEGDAEEVADAEWLDGLVEDLDLRALLPHEEVAVGDAWEVDLAAFAALLEPGGSFPWDDDDEEEDDDEGLRIVLMGFAPEELYDELEGECTAKLVELEEDRAVVKLAFELESEADLVDHFTERLGTEGETTREFDEADATVGLEGEAELVWDVARGTFASFVLEGDLESSLDATWTHSRIESGGVDLSLYEEESGTLRVEAAMGE